MPAPPQESAWTGERVARLVSMWERGISAGLIARELGVVTRSAVIAKVHRLGLAHRTTHNAMLRTYTKPPGRHARRTQVNGHGESCPQASKANSATVRPRYLPELGAGMCRYPLSEPAGPNTLFCAAAIARDSYCAQHYRLCHIADPRRRSP